MQGNLIKNILACLVLVALCFVLGAQAAEDVKTSIVFLAGIAGLVFMFILGTRIWVLFFLLPPLLLVVPLPGPFAHVSVELYTGLIVLPSWVLMWSMGYVKFRWRSILILDILVLLLMAYIVATFIRRPVAINVIGLDSDDIGGADYVYAIFASTYYLGMSCIPMEHGKLAKVLRWSVPLFLAGVALKCGINIARYGSVAIFSDALDSQVSYLFLLGVKGITYIYVAYSLTSILVNPLLIVSSAFCCLSAMLCGGRASFMELFTTLTAVSFIKREFLVCFMLGLMALGGIYTLSAVSTLESLPYGVQRVFTMLPGLNLNQHAARSAAGTWQWRLDLWDMAFDERTGYINDYVFGDGFGQSRSATERRGRALMRGEYVYGQDLDEFAVNGVWHNGVITTIHRLGYVGLGIISFILIVGNVLLFRTCMALRGTPLFLPVVFYVCNFVGFVPLFCWGHADLKTFLETFVPLSLIKLAYCEAREAGLIKPWFRRGHYVPQMIQEYERRGGLEVGADVMRMK